MYRTRALCVHNGRRGRTSISTYSRAMFALALLSLSFSLGACKGGEVIFDPPIPPQEPFLRFAADGKSMELQGEATIIQSTTSDGLRSDEDFVGIFAGSNVGGLEGTSYLLWLFIPASFDQFPRTFPLSLLDWGESAYTGQAFGIVIRTEGNAGFGPTAVAGTVIITSFTEERITGTFSFNQVGNIVDNDDNIIQTNVNVNITDGSFDLPLEVLVP